MPDLSGVEAGESTLNESAVDLAGLSQRTAALMEAKLRAGELTLACHLPAGLPLLYADEPAIKQILLNPLANAVQFNKPVGKVTLAVQRTENALELARGDPDHSMISEERRAGADVV